MADWPTIASLATASGTLVLAAATFASVRSANRAARTAERALQVGLRPVLAPSRVTDPPEKVMWVDRHWATVTGSRGSVELVDENVYLAMSLRNVGSGIAVLQGWRASSRLLLSADPPGAVEDFRLQTRDLYVPPGDVGFWQGAIRERDDADYAGIVGAISGQEPITIELLYSDHEGGQRAISRFSLMPRGDETTDWLCWVSRHWYLDRPAPR